VAVGRHLSAVIPRLSRTAYMFARRVPANQRYIKSEPGNLVPVEWLADPTPLPPEPRLLRCWSATMPGSRTWFAGRMPHYGSNPNTVSCVWPATNTFPFATSGMENFAALSRVSRLPAWLLS